MTRAFRFAAAPLWGALDAAPKTAGRGLLVAILAGAFILRLGLAWRLPTIHYADEVYQVAEQASRAVHGYGIVSWEFRTASRAALLPLAVEPIYRAHLSPTAERLLQAALFSALSLLPVWVAYRWAERLHGRGAAVLCGVMMATWFELVYFGPKPLPDVVCSYLLFAGLYLSRPGAGGRALVAAGALLTMALAVRVQIAPAVGVVSLLAVLVGGRPRVVRLAAGAAVGLVVAGTMEWMWWGVPFQGQIGYLKMEFEHHASSYFSREPITFFLKQYILIFGPALPVVGFLVWAGARRAPVVALTALALVVPFHLIGHKEYRFLVVAAPMVVLLMGLASAEIVGRFALWGRPVALSWLAAGWIAAMLAIGFGDYYRALWTRFGNHVLAFEEIGRDPDACGVALVGVGWWQTPGQSGLGRDIPIYQITSEQDRDRLLAAANYVLEGTKQPQPPPPYVQYRAYTRPVQYLYRRPGGCLPDPAARIVFPPGIPGGE